MKRAVWLLASGVMVSWGLASALGGCGGSNDTSVAGDDGGASSSGATSSGATSSGSTSSSSSSTSSGSSGTPDGGTPDGSSTSSSGGSTPGAITCGAQSCSVANLQSCCERSDGGMGCIDGGGGGPGSGCGFGSLRLRCDESADCAPGDRCCLGFGGSQCDNGPCQFGSLQLCQTNTECPDAGTCKTVTCNFGGQTNYTLKACNTNQACQ